MQIQLIFCKIFAIMDKVVQPPIFKKIEEQSMATTLRKILALSLVCVMLLGILPPLPISAETPVLLSASEQESVILASYANDEIKLNGNPNESSWNLHQYIGDNARFGAQWNNETLYIGVKNPDKQEISIALNNTALNADNAQIKSSANKKNNEYAVSLDKIGVTVKDYGTTINASIQVGDETWTGKIVLTSTYWLTLPKAARGSADMAITDLDRLPTAKQGVKETDTGLNFYDLYNPKGANPRAVRSYAVYTDKKDFGKALADKTQATVVEFDFHASKMPVYEQGADNEFWSYIPTAGFAAWLTDAVGADNKPYMVSFGIINTDIGLVFVVHDDVQDYTYVLNKQVGDTFHVGLTWTPDGDLSVAIDGATVATYKGVEFKPVWWELAPSTLTLNCCRSVNAAESAEDDIDFDINNLKVGKSLGESVTDALTFRILANKNESQTAVKSDLALPATMDDEQTGLQYSIQWSSSDPSVIGTDGKVTQPDGNGKTVTLTAKLSENGTDLGLEKSLDVFVVGLNPSAGTLVTQNDTVTYKMKGVVYDAPTFTLDTTNNSIIRDLGEVKTVNVIALKDGDEITRLNESMLTIWASDDNKGYKQVDSFKMLRAGQYTYLYDFEANGRYIKVHSTTHDATDPDFTGPLDGMIEAYYENVFGDGGTAFEKKSTVTLKNDTANTVYDAVYVLSPEEAGVSCVSAEKADVRFYLGNELLYHYYDGENFLVRVTKIEANGSVTLKVLSGNANAMNISDKEYVYEVVYGTRETFNRMYGRWYLSLPSGMLISYSGIGASDKPFSYMTSQDEGRTWSTGILADGSHDFLCIPYGDIYDEDSGRILVQGTRTMENGKLSTRIMYSDDLGKSWNKTTMNWPEDAQYFQNYVDFTKCASYDGEDGPGVDFVFPAAINDTRYPSTPGVATTIVVYTKDCGKTWEMSESRIYYPEGEGLQVRESGVCEASIICAEDGTLVLYARCQFENTNHFAVSYSYDNGITWTEEAVLSNIYGTNTQPILFDFEGAKMVMWGGNNALGGASYRRYPMNVALSYDGAKTFEGIQDIFLRTAYQGMTTGNRFDVTNPTVGQVGDSLIVSFTGDGHFSLRVDEFADYMFLTKGAYDSFENATPEFEGWAITGGMIDNSADHASDGENSMKFSVGASAVRSIPSLSNGKISFDLWIDDAAKADVEIELESSFAIDYGVAAPVAFELNGKKLTFLGAKSAVDVDLKNGWNTFVFDLLLDGDTQSATLSINGGAAINAPINHGDIHTYVSYVSVNCNGAETYYLDNFLAEDNDVVLYTEKQVNTEITDLSEVPAALAERFETIDDLKAYMQGRMTAEHGEAYTADNSKFMSLALPVSTDGGATFRDTVPNDIPMEGIEIRLDYPEGTTSVSHEFKLIQLFTQDSNRHSAYAGKYNSPVIRERADGLYVTVLAASPILLSWEQVAEIPAETDPVDPSDPGDPSDPSVSDDTTGKDGGLPIALIAGIGAGAVAVIAAIAVVLKKKSKK